MNYGDSTNSARKCQRNFHNYLRKLFTTENSARRGIYKALSDGRAGQNERFFRKTRCPRNKTGVDDSQRTEESTAKDHVKTRAICIWPNEKSEWPKRESKIENRESRIKKKHALPARPAPATAGPLEEITVAPAGRVHLAGTRACRLQFHARRRRRRCMTRSATSTSAPPIQVAGSGMGTSSMSFAL